MKTSADNFQRPQFEVSDILRLYGKEYRFANGLTKRQHQVMDAITRCRTSYYGYHVDQCTECGYTENEYNSCRDRHCPKCQGIARKKWVEKRIEDLLSVTYYHAVFTLPHFLHSMILYNRRLIYELLFSKAAETLSCFGKDPQWLGGELGFFGVLHSWGQTLWQHPHVHFIIAGGALTEDDQWVEPEYQSKFLFPVKALSKVFRGKFVEGLKDAYYSDGLVIPPDQPHLKKAEDFEQWIDRLVGRDWVVYCKSPFKDAEKVVRYVGRYTHRVAISNQRLIKIKDGKVQFWYKNYKNKTITWEKMRLEAQEFIRRFMWHILPPRFHKIRHFGFLANGKCKAAIEHIRQLLDIPNEEAELSEDIGIGKSCPICQKGFLVPLYIIDTFGHLFMSFQNRFNNKYLFDTS
jgi:predicted Zn-ribbon and HTH transcriptional regulator